jgi:hypothetical protein
MRATFGIRPTGTSSTCAPHWTHSHFPFFSRTGLPRVPHPQVLSLVACPLVAAACNGGLPCHRLRSGLRRRYGPRGESARSDDAATSDRRCWRGAYDHRGSTSPPSPQTFLILRLVSATFDTRQFVGRSCVVSPASNQHGPRLLTHRHGGRAALGRRQTPGWRRRLGDQLGDGGGIRAGRRIRRRRSRRCRRQWRSRS